MLIQIALIHMLICIDPNYNEDYVIKCVIIGNIVNEDSVKINNIYK